MRKLGIAAACILLICIGLFLYTEYDFQKFKEQLSPVPDTSATEIGTPTVLAHKNESASPETKPTTETITSDRDATQPAERLFTDSPNLLLNADVLYDEETSLFLCDAISFKFTNQSETYERLHTILTERYRNDPRVSQFLDLWREMTSIVDEINSYGIEGKDVNAFLELAPDVVFDEYLEVSLGLLDISEVIAAKVRADVNEWADAVYRLEIANAALPLVKEAISKGEMTVEEAKVFFKELAGFDTDIIVETIPE